MRLLVRKLAVFSYFLCSGTEDPAEVAQPQIEIQYCQEAEVLLPKATVFDYRAFEEPLKVYTAFVFPPCFPSLTLHHSLQADLQQQEELLYKERKDRERIIASYRKKVEERKAQAEKVDRRVRSTWWFILCVHLLLFFM